MVKTLGDRIRYYRNLNGWSQNEVADRLNISVLAISNIERNITDINYSRLKQLADIFRISVSELTNISSKPSEFGDFQKALLEKEKEIIKLQKRIIELQDKKLKKKGK